MIIVIVIIIIVLEGRWQCMQDWESDEIKTKEET